jgi:hypothetical protein
VQTAKDASRQQNDQHHQIPVSSLIITAITSIIITRGYSTNNINRNSN